MADITFYSKHNQWPSVNTNQCSYEALAVVGFDRLVYGSKGHMTYLYGLLLCSWQTVGLFNTSSFSSLAAWVFCNPTRAWPRVCPWPLLELRRSVMHLLSCRCCPDIFWGVTKPKKCNNLKSFIILLNARIVWWADLKIFSGDSTIWYSWQPCESVKHASWAKRIGEWEGNERAHQWSEESSDLSHCWPFSCH